MKKSAGILLYKQISQDIQVLLVHPGGPFWQNKDLASWTIPKGEVVDGEILIDAARREFKEETGQEVTGEFMELSPVKYSGKIVYAFAIKGELDPQKIVSNMFEMEWPPKSGKFEKFFEVDRGTWFRLPTALEKIVKGQVPFILELAEKLDLELKYISNEQPALF